jgi:hypothetical protein
MAPWEVLFDPEFDSIEEFRGYPETVRDRILAMAIVLAQQGPLLGRPLVDTIKGSAIANLKELRVQVGGDPWRVLFAFDIERRAILLCGGNTVGQNQQRWYGNLIAIAEQRAKRHKFS